MAAPDMLLWYAALPFLVMGTVVALRRRKAVTTVPLLAAGAIAVLYALLLSTAVYREIGFSDIASICLKAAQTTAVVMFLIAASIAMSWILAYENVPAMVAEALVNVSDNPLVILLLINIVLLLVGIFMDMTPALLIFTPIFLTDDPVETSQVIIAMSADRPLQSVAEMSGQRASDFFRQIAAEAEAKGATLEFGLSSFRVTARRN